MNILKALYRDSSLGNEASKYTEDGLILSIEGFASCSWSIRNAAQILLGKSSTLIVLEGVFFLLNDNQF